MKKIVNRLSKTLYKVFFLVFDFIIDFLFCIRLFINLKKSYNCGYDEYHIKNIKVLLQFFGRSFDNSSFEYYNLYKEDSMYLLHYSLKKKNNLIFQIFIFLYCFIVDYFLFELVNILLPIFRDKLVDNIFCKLHEVIKKQIEKNFGYEYLREYKEYYRINFNKKYYHYKYSKIRFKILYKETLLNLSYLWNKTIIKDNKQSRLFINTNHLIEDIEKDF